MTWIRIAPCGDHPTVAFAAAELQRCLARATGHPVHLQRPGAAEDGLPAIRLGLQRDVPGAVVPALPPNADPRLDDAVGIATAGADGYICGNNPRSVLLAVYRYLHALGCRWVRPGVEGEDIPPIDLARTTVNVAETPSYRHRGICIEGAVSYEHVADLIDWMPKVGLNAYFVQFREGFTFFDRWYSHPVPPQAEPAPAFTVERARALVRAVAAQAKQRDLLYHAVGHGWTCEPFGIPGLGWDYPPPPVPPEAAPFLALVDGTRALWGGIPINTSLCYSNREVRRIMTDGVVDYAREHPEVDLLHFWLADGANNQCECAHCRTMQPADWYVMLLNEIDRKLGARQLATRIVLLAYFDLLWPPEHERIENPERFTLMFAPITRTYSATFATEQTLPALPPFARNRLEFPSTVAENIAFLRAWQAHCVHRDGSPMDSFDFDYHLMWDPYRDPGGLQTARVLHGDLQALDALGLRGFISCQAQRAFLPTGLPMAILGWTLWDKTRDFASLAQDYFAAAFGADGPLAAAYLASLSRLFDPPYLRGERVDGDAHAAGQLAQVAAVVAAFMPTIKRNLERANACHARSWLDLQQHAGIATELAGALRERAIGHAPHGLAAWLKLRQRIWQIEDTLHPVLDAWLFTRVYDGIFGVQSQNTEA